MSQVGQRLCKPILADPSFTYQQVFTRLPVNALGKVRKAELWQYVLPVSYTHRAGVTGHSTKFRIRRLSFGGVGAFGARRSD
jgi:hypothetical protein